jgi:TPR repeat protein
MGRYELIDAESAGLGQGTGSGERFFELGIMYSIGRSVPTDLVSAHKWFNLAVISGNQDAVRYRREIAAEMSEAEIAAAQRAARDWLRARQI